MTLDASEARGSARESRGREFVPAVRFPLETLTDLYNATRADYLVPMQMTADEMRRYVARYDVDLEASVVMLERGEPVGLAMLGVRGRRGWVTRLGVMPRWRRRAAGRRLAATVVERARARGLDRLELEVIRENHAARRLFASLGFRSSRELSVASREADARFDAQPLVGASLVDLDRREALARLASRGPGASWLTQTESFEEMGRLRGYEKVGGSRRPAWVAFRAGSRVLDHIVLGGRAGADESVGLALLGRLHADYPGRRAKVQNLPVDHPVWTFLRQTGYTEEFRRIEMWLSLAKLS